MNTPPLSLLGDELVQSNSLSPDSMAAIDPFHLVGQWNLDLTAYDLDELEDYQRSISAANDPVPSSPERSTLTEGNMDGRHTSPVPPSYAGQSTSSDFEQQREEMIASATRERELYQREWLIASLDDEREMLRAIYAIEYEPLAADDERTDGRFSDIQVEAFVQTLPWVVISSLGPDDINCSICRSEYGKKRGESTTSVTGSESEQQVFSGQDLREFPVRLPCGHVFGDWCISTWLRSCRPPSCPVCRSSFQPAR